MKLNRWVSGLLPSFMVITLIFWALIPSTFAEAHAEVVRTFPIDGAVLEKAPQSVVIEFSEAVDPHLTEIKLISSSSQVVVPGPGTVDPGKPTILTLNLPSLPDGGYTAVWQARSADDGHLTAGSLSFSIGKASPPLSMLPPPGAPDPASALPLAGDSLLRWLGYLSACLLVGSLFFGIWVWRPAFRAWPGSSLSADEIAGSLLRRFILIGSVALILATAAEAIFQAVQVSRGEFHPPFWMALGQLLDFRSGFWIWSRMLLALIIEWFSRRLPLPGSGGRRMWWSLALIAAGLLLTFSLQSHAAASGSAFAVLFDWFHLLAVFAWIGGLLPLAVLVLWKTMPISILIPRFSRLALVCVTALALTGLLDSLILVGSLEALTQTAYGHVLIVKTGLFLLLIGLGAINLLVVSPRLFRGGSLSGRTLRVTVFCELLIGGLVLLAAGILSGTSPAGQALEAQRRLGFVEAAREGPVEIKLWVTPARAGENEFGVDIAGVDLNPAQSSPVVQLRLSTVDGEMGPTQIETTQQSAQRFLARSSIMNMDGAWYVEVTLRRSGFGDVRHMFKVQVKTDP